MAEKKEAAKVVAHHPKVIREVTVLPEIHAPQWIQGFVNFVREQGVIGLAVGLVLGAQIKSLVDQMIASFVNPMLGLILPGNGDLTKKVFALSFNGKTQDFGWGAFVASWISFIFVAAIVYFSVKALKLDKLDKKKV